MSSHSPYPAAPHPASPPPQKKLIFLQVIYSVARHIGINTTCDLNWWVIFNNVINYVTVVNYFIYLFLCVCGKLIYFKRLEYYKGNS